MTGDSSIKGSSLRGLLVMLRVSNLPTIWTNVLAGALLCSAALSARGLVSLLVSLSCFYVGGMALNDLWDRQWDSVHRPDRPIPSGQVSLSMARAVTVLLFAAAFAALLMAPSWLGLPAGGVLLLAIMLYDRLHKQSRLGPYLMALCRFMTYPVTALALCGELPWAVLAGASAQFVYVLALTLMARSRGRVDRPKQRSSFPLVPLLIAGISMVDGVVLALFISPWLLMVGIAGGMMTLLAQRLVPGD